VRLAYTSTRIGLSEQGGISMSNYIGHSKSNYQLIGTVMRIIKLLLALMFIVTFIITDIQSNPSGAGNASVISTILAAIGLISILATCYVAFKIHEEKRWQRIR
jgi:hypothetical protein